MSNLVDALTERGQELVMIHTDGELLLLAAARIKELEAELAEAKLTIENLEVSLREAWNY